MNTLYYGDNLDVLQRYIRDESVDLIYLDPPFNSNANYNVLFTQKDGKQSSAQIQAFEDTWQWDQNAIQTYTREVEKGGPIADALRAFNLILGDSNMMADLTMMAPRLKELHRVLKPTGSLYLHCDPTGSHYLKVVMDTIFRPVNFRNEIIWKRTTAHSSAKRYGPIHDTIFFYTNDIESLTFNPKEKSLREEYSELAVKMHFIHTDRQGRRYRLYPSGKRFYLDEGKLIDDVWTDIKTQSATSPIMPEYTGFPTQKSERLLDRIISASSNDGDIVLDCFAGSGTTGAVAEKLGRKWIMIDSSKLAIYTMQKRMLNLKAEIGNKGKALKPKPFVLYNAGLYLESGFIEKMDETDYRKFPKPFCDHDELKDRAVITRRAKKIDFECIARGYIIGTGWNDYQKTGGICGKTLPNGLKLADRLERPIFTPSKKAD